jgi:hypothetical protein
MSIMHKYREPFQTPGTFPAWLVALIGRLPIGTEPLALLLFGRHVSGSLAVGGAMAGLFVLGNAAGAIVQGRLIDTYGPTRALLPIGSLHFIALMGVIVAPTGLGLALAAVAGFSLPQISACIRAMWATNENGAGWLPTAFAMETLVMESTGIIGPLLAVLAFTVDPRLPVAGSALFCLIGAVGFAVSGPARNIRGNGQIGRRIAVVTQRDPLLLLLVSVLVGVLVGGIDVALAAYTAKVTGTGYVGAFIACIAIGSLIGGLTYGARQPAVPQRTQLTLLLLTFATASLVIFAVPRPVVVGVLCLLIGSAIAPTYTILSLMLNEMGGAGAAAGTYTIFITSLLIGSSIGTATTAYFADNLNGSAGFLGGLTATALAALIAWLALNKKVEGADTGVGLASGTGSGGDPLVETL